MTCVSLGAMTGNDQRVAIDFIEYKRSVAHNGLSFVLVNAQQKSWINLTRVIKKY